eukprot:CAMPEP_0115377452 /NCGR_PEP_ID=MMETSP0271-20121206/3495_1 /TAXON_ID=71861 /ORGANISM="Scrippsiella trochoidea, Strain CCMP3099" /LENGTH=36 /DNA_ID= /DNA_START= /DNA_END= /DNA_ORIENTATION=
MGTIAGAMQATSKTISKIGTPTDKIRMLTNHIAREL